MEGEKLITPDNVGSNENVLIINRMQIELAQRKGMDLEKWVDKYSEAFRNVLHLEIIRDPHFLKHNQQTPQATFELFEAELYKNEKPNDEKLIDQFEDDKYQEAA